MKQHDTHAITLYVRDKDKALVDLAGLTPKVLATPFAGGTTVILASTLGPTIGTVVHQLTGTLTPGSYRVEIEFTSGAGVVTTAPTVGQAILVIEPDLG